MPCGDERPESHQEAKPTDKVQTRIHSTSNGQSQVLNFNKINHLRKCGSFQFPFSFWELTLTNAKFTCGGSSGAAASESLSGTFPTALILLLLEKLVWLLKGVRWPRGVRERWLKLGVSDKEAKRDDLNWTLPIS